MMESATYLVTREIAERSGLIDTRYRIADGRFVLNDRDLARVRFTPDEYISGLQGVEKVSTQEAELLIAQNNYTMGLNDVAAPITETNEQSETPVEEQESENGDENEEVVDETEKINDETEQENNEQETNEEE